MSTTDNIPISTLEEIAAQVLDLKKRSRPRRPIILEFCGSPKSGKTSCLSSLNLFLKRNGFATRLLAERASVCPIHDKFNPHFNIWTSNAAIAELSETVCEYGKSLDVIIADRGIFDALCWFKWLAEHDHLKEQDYAALRTYLTCDKLISLIDIVYVLHAEPEVSMDREYACLLTRKHGSIMNPKVLKDFRSSIFAAVTEYTDLFRCVRLINTSEMPQNDVSYEVTVDVLHTLEELIREKVAYFPRVALAGYEDRMCWDWHEFEVPPILYDRRDVVEEDESKVQPVPIVVVTDAARERVLVVRKRPDSVRNGSAERGKILAYFGGHIRREDNLHGNSEDFVSIARTCLSREIQEELNVSLDIKDPDPLCLWVKGNKGSEKHLGIAFVYEADFDHLCVRLDDYEFIQRKGQSASGHVIDIKSFNVGATEQWTRLILRERLGVDLQGQFLFDDLI